ncbi:MAG: DUF6036 family nucleotidyltransferase [Terriglobales bacterium]
MSPNVPEPWNSFIRDLDQVVKGPADFHCIGGFVVTNLYHFERQTRDLDVLAIRSTSDLGELYERAQEGSELHKKHHVYLHRVTVIEAYPEDYDTRMTEMYAGAFTNIRLFAVEAHDLALMKLQRNNERDREDVKHLARTRCLTIKQLQDRYAQEMRSYIALPEQRTDPIVELWIEMIREELERPKA